jgi:hypothetical protein
MSMDFGPLLLKIDSLRNAFAAAFLGAILAAISFPILNLTAHWWGRFARVMLSNTADLEPTLKARTE